jgi:hypothetical protein
MRETQGERRVPRTARTRSQLVNLLLGLPFLMVVEEGGTHVSDVGAGACE